RRDADLDHVPAEHEHDRPGGLVGRYRARDDLAQRARGELVWQRAQERGRRGGLERARELAHRDLRRPVGGAQSLEPREISLGVAPHQGASCSTVSAAVPAFTSWSTTFTEPMITLLFICTGMRRSSSVSQITSLPLFLKM